MPELKTVTLQPALFKDVPCGTEFIDDEGDRCVKVDEHNAKTPWCARWFVAGFRPDEIVWPIPKPT